MKISEKIEELKHLLSVSVNEYLTSHNPSEEMDRQFNWSFTNEGDLENDLEVPLTEFDKQFGYKAYYEVTVRPIIEDNKLIRVDIVDIF